jgi:hypothetical protein
LFLFSNQPCALLLFFVRAFPQLHPENNASETTELVANSAKAVREVNFEQV